MEIEAMVEVPAGIEVEAERKIDGDGEKEAAKRILMRRLRGSEVDSDAEVAERHKRMKESYGDLGDKVWEEVKKVDLKRESVERMGPYEEYLEWKRRKDEEEERNRDPEMLTDYHAYEARLFRKNWDNYYGSFDDKTKIPCKRFLHNLPPHGGTEPNTLQVFYLKVGGISDCLQWPLEVFGLVALRDSLDCNRNIIFERERDDCQILTKQYPYLVLTGPVRAVMIYGRVIFEASLYVRGATRSDDKELSLLATSLGSFNSLHSRMIRSSYMSRLSTLELTIGHITYSVEATIEVRVTSGLWPYGFRCQIDAYADSIGLPVVLLDTEYHDVLVTGGEINLARQVVSVESGREMKVMASFKNGSVVYKAKKSFKPLEMGSDSKQLRLGDCMLEVTVFWSRFPFPSD